MAYQPKSYRRFIATAATGTLVSSAIDSTIKKCVMCSRDMDIDKEPYEVGESLGEYWCEDCAHATGRDEE